MTFSIFLRFRSSAHLGIKQDNLTPIDRLMILKSDCTEYQYYASVTTAIVWLINDEGDHLIIILFDKSVNTVKCQDACLELLISFIFKSHIRRLHQRS